MVLTRGNPHDIDLPGPSTLIGGMWIINLNYWGGNQYIVQRALDNAMRQDGELHPDRACPTLLALLPAGLKGVAFAATAAA